jgi:hypothetical protein
MELRRAAFGSGERRLEWWAKIVRDVEAVWPFIHHR